MQDFWKTAISFWLLWEPDGVRCKDVIMEAEERAEWEKEGDQELEELDPEVRFEVWGFEL